MNDLRDLLWTCLQVELQIFSRARSESRFFMFCAAKSERETTGTGNA